MECGEESERNMPLNQIVEIIKNLASYLPFRLDGNHEETILGQISSIKFTELTYLYLG